ncbi:MAG: YbaB/EbfC family nucleoid-associated protein [Phycisphaerae bacterium]|nr:YbaB/EbfC family nucleoid-associated protein [Phycisphaerae bacterium]
MFDKLKAAAGMAGLLADLPRIKAKFAETKEELGRLQCMGHSSCRRVRVIMNGRLEMVSTDMDPHIASAAGTPSGRAELQQAVLEASNDAIQHARREAAERVADVAQELGVPIPRSLLEHL